VKKIKPNGWLKKVPAQFHWTSWVTNLFCYGGAWQLCHS